jgi:hypothetical protein
MDDVAPRLATSVPARNDSRRRQKCFTNKSRSTRCVVIRIEVVPVHLVAVYVPTNNNTIFDRIESNRMDEAMRRVVSEPDDMAEMMIDDDATAGSVQSSLADQHSPQWGMARQPNHSNDWASSKPLHAPFPTIENYHRLQDTNYDSSSSLSHDGNENDPDDDEPLAYFPANSNNNASNNNNNTTTTQNSPKLHRSNSRSSSSSSSQMAPSSQTSSRDWGWFDDVNMSDRKLTKQSHKDDNHNNHKKKTKIPNTMMEDNGMYGYRVFVLFRFDTIQLLSSLTIPPLIVFARLSYRIIDHGRHSPQLRSRRVALVPTSVAGIGRTAAAPTGRRAGLF